MYSSVTVLLCAFVVSYVAFVLSLFVPHLSFFWCLGRAMVCDCGISWVSSHIFLQGLRLVKHNVLQCTIYNAPLDVFNYGNATTYFSFGLCEDDPQRHANPIIMGRIPFFEIEIDDAIISTFNITSAQTFLSEDMRLRINPIKCQSGKFPHNF